MLEPHYELWVVYNIHRSSVQLNISTPTTFDQFVTPTKWLTSKYLLFYHCNIFLINKLALVLRTKFLKKINKKTRNKTSTKILLLFSPLVLRYLPVYTSSKTTFTKTFYFILSTVFFLV